MTYRTIQKIRFDDVDGAGIVYYPQFFSLCHNTFEDFFDSQTGIPYPELIGKRRQGFPTVAIKSDFSAPLRYGDVALVDLDLNRIGRTSLAFDFTIYRQADGAKCFTATITTVFLDLDTHKPIPIPDEIRDALKRLGEPTSGS